MRGPHLLGLMALKEMTYFDADFKIHTSYHNSFFILRTPIHINGLPVQIRSTGQGPLLNFTQSGVTISVKLWEISRLVGPIFYNHGVYHVDTFYHEQFPLFQVAFPSEASLKKFLLASDTVSSEVEAALTEMFTHADQRAQSSEPGKAANATPLSVQAKVELFLVSPSHEKNKAPTIHPITLSNFSCCTSLWKNSELFEFGRVFAMYCTSTAEEAEPSQISTQPQDQVEAVTMAVFTVQATGTEPLIYCWEWKPQGHDEWKVLYKGVDGVHGTDTATLTIANLQKSHEGSYRCTASNCAGRLVSNPANLTLADPPKIESHPQDSKVVIAKEEITFFVRATGTQPLSYRWDFKPLEKDWQALPGCGDRIQGVNTTSLTISGVQKSDEGSYRCTVSNNAGRDTSDTATVTIIEPVELVDLLNELQDVDDWFHFGIYLKVPTYRLREIKSENQTVTDRKINMLDDWSNQVVPTWAGVVKALVGMGRKALATHIGTKYGVHVPESVSREPIQTFLRPESGEHLVMNTASVQKHKDHLMETEEKLMTTEGSVKAASTAEVIASGECDEIKNSLSQLQKEVRKVTQEMTAMWRELESKKEENEALKELKDIYKAKSKKNAGKLLALQRVIDAKEEEIRGIRRELQAKEAESQSLFHKVDALRRELDDKIRELIEKTERVQELQQEKDELIGICNIERRQLEMLLQQVAAQREPHELYIKEVGQQLSATKEEIEAKMHQGETFGIEKDSLVEEIKTLSTKLEKQQSDVAVLRKELDSQEAIPAEMLLKKKGKLIKIETEFLEMKIKLLQVEGRKKQIERLKRITLEEQGQMIEASTQLQSVLGEPPKFTLHPENCKAVGDAVFLCQATGTEPLIYCWEWKPQGHDEWKALSNGVDGVHGAETATLTMASLQKSHEGSYRCQVTNCAGSMVSKSASLTVVDPPKIVSHPQDCKAVVEERITFSIKATGTPPLSYYWESKTLGKDWQFLPYSGDRTLKKVETTTLVITNVHKAHEGSYRCTAINCAGSETSQPAQLTLEPAVGGGPKRRVTGWLKKAFFAKKNVPVLLVNGGHLDEVEEQYLLFCKMRGLDVTAIPKIPPGGFYSESIDFMDITFTVFCLAYGRRPPSHLFTSTFQKMYAVVFIVTGNDRERISVAREKLLQLLNEEKLRDAPLLILASKQDLPNAMSKEEVVDKLGLPSVKNRIWHIQPMSTKGDGLCEGMHWLHEQSEQTQTLNTIVQPPTCTAF